jgi:hypothetical protein
VLSGCGRADHAERAQQQDWQGGAGIGRQVKTLCQGEAGLQPQLALFHVSDNFVLPHATQTPIGRQRGTSAIGQARQEALTEPGK